MSDKDQLAAMTVEVILETWPRTARVFHAYKMACVGCVLAPFYSLEEATSIYHIPLNEFIEDLQLVIAEENQAHVSLDLTTYPLSDHP